MKRSIATSGPNVAHRRATIGWQWMTGCGLVLAIVGIGSWGCSPTAEKPAVQEPESVAGGGETAQPPGQALREQPPPEQPLPEQPEQPSRPEKPNEQPQQPEQPQQLEHPQQSEQPQQPAEQPGQPDTSSAAEQPAQMPAQPETPPITYPAGEEPTAEPPAEGLPGAGALQEPGRQPPASEDVALGLGPPLVEHPERLKRLNPQQPLWLDPEGKRVVMIGQVCQTDAPLEVFACLKETKEHEAVLSVDVQAYQVHAALLAIGARVGHPVQWDPEYVPATGSVIEVTVHWKDAQGKPHSARAQDWIRDARTKRAMEHEWVFAGSRFWEDPETGQRHYEAETGEFICVSNFSNAMLDLPIESSQANSALLFEAFTERIPPLGTPVTIVLKPKPAGPDQPAQAEQPEHRSQPAVDAPRTTEQP